MNDQKTNDLLFCPFCKSQPGYKAIEKNGQLICGVCGARGPHRKFEWMIGKDTARGRWNIRTI